MPLNIRNPIRLFCFAVIFIATSSYCGAQTATANDDAPKSVGGVIASNRYLLKHVDSTILNLPKGTKTKYFKDGNDPIVLLLRAGVCDKAYKIILTTKKSYLDLYCFTMALAGRADELPDKVEPFRTHPAVMRKLRDEEVSFEHLCEVATRHGTALRHVMDNDFEAAVAEFRAIDKPKNALTEYYRIPSSIALEVLQVAGPKDCIAVLEEFSKSDEPETPSRKKRSKRKNRVTSEERTFEGMFATVSSAMYFADPKKMAELKRELLPKHVYTFARELWSVVGQISTPKFAQAQHLIPFTLSKISEMEEEESAKIKSTLLNSGAVDAAIKDRLAAENFQWLQSKPEGDHRTSITSICPWLLANGKIDQLKELALQYDEKNKLKYASVIHNAMNAARYDFPQQMVKLAGWLPNPEDITKFYGIDTKVTNLLIESRQFDLAENWITHIEDEKLKNAITAKLELYRDLVAKDALTADQFFAGVKELIADSKVLEQDFYYELGNDYLAEITQRHGVKTAIAIARQLPDVAVSYRTTRANEVASSLLRRKRVDDLLSFADLLTREERTNQSFGLKMDSLPLNSKVEFIDKLANAFPDNRHLLRQRIRKSVGDGDKEKALRLNLQGFDSFGQCIEVFVGSGWEQECYEGVKASASKGSAGAKLVRETVSKIAGELCLRKGNKAAVDFINQHTSDPKERMHFYSTLEDEYLGNHSFAIWMYN